MCQLVLQGAAMTQRAIGEAAEIAEDEFRARFKARMLARAGEWFDDGDSIADYADECAPTYFETDWQRVMGPEECADADISYWGE